MSNIVVVGAQWGDEGKGKIVDLLTESAHVVARYQGGHNAGHTVIIKKRQFILHLIPSGILRRGKKCVVGNGVVVEPASLIKEIKGLRRRGVTVGKNLFISGKAHVIMPYHMALEGRGETKRGDRKIGTTGRGIGPTYSDKMSRTGIRMIDLLNREVFREKLKDNLTEVNFLLRNRHGSRGISFKKVYDYYMKYADFLAPFITDTTLLVNKLIDSGRDILFEGAQGTLLDIDHGTYPYVTSSSATAGGVCTGLGVSPTKIDGIVGIMKAYTTRVGGGPFPTELTDDMGGHLRLKGGEYGATTGRPRRCGWLDAVSLKHSIRINGFTGIALTKLDVLDGLDTIRVCTSYRYSDSGGKPRVTKEMPQDNGVFERCEPVYKELPGWKQSTKGIKKFRDLPKNARAYIRHIEELLNVSIDIISTGQKRDEVIVLRNPLRGKKRQ
jgi:adenylosuccinate synthase